MSIPFRSKIYLPLLVILIIGLLGACANPAPPVTPPPPTPSSENPSESPNISSVPNESSSVPDRVDIVYFHRANACHCMQVIEENIHNTVLLNFQKDLDSGKLTFTSLASDDKVNAAMVTKYNTGLFGLFIVIVKDKTEKIVPVEEIWSMTGDEAKYTEYVKNIIAKSLNGEL
ncbi:MAG: hypothetical protein JXB43_02930 [Dehalococcoidia bacterium]|nr:hypothetical protein [Dehalococcoidia bacterium]